jgi:acetyl-CoA acyltransferase
MTSSVANPSDAVILDAVRTPVGKRNGSLADIHPVDLSARVLRALLSRNNVEPDMIDDVVWGVVGQVGDQSVNVARSAVLAAGMPESVPGVTLDRQCGSSQQAVTFAAASVLAGHYDAVIAGGTESMTRVPMGSGRVGGEPFGPTVKKRYGVEGFSQGLGAEILAERWGLSRTQVDEYSARSHELAKAAQTSAATAAGRITLPELDRDECVRDTSVEILARLRPVFKEDGVVTAGNSSAISDGSAGLLLASARFAAEHGLEPVARIHSVAVTGDDPVTMLAGVLPATRKVLKTSGLSLRDIGVFEVNEAFAPVPLTWLAEFPVDLDRLNPCGGAIAVGHPLGGSGAILMTRMIGHMRDRGIRYGLQTMCEGGGMANATIVELLA